jgi:hypothetical protein
MACLQPSFRPDADPESVTSSPAEDAAEASRVPPFSCVETTRGVAGATSERPFVIGHRVALISTICRVSEMENATALLAMPSGSGLGRERR